MEGLIICLAPGSVIPECIRNSRCTICSCKQDRGNSRLVLGWSLGSPLKYFSYCNNCDRELQAERRRQLRRKYSVWISSCGRLENFESRDVALHTIMTVAVQGFCYGPARYNARDALYLCNMADKASPSSFWSGLRLTVTATGTVCPTRKFTADRIVFRDGKSLSYGAEEQILVASSEFENW